MLFADATNPAWDMVRRKGALDALDRYDTLSPTQRQQLLAVGTAVIWLAKPA